MLANAGRWRKRSQHSSSSAATERYRLGSISAGTPLRVAGQPRTFGARHGFSMPCGCHTWRQPSHRGSIERRMRENCSISPEEAASRNATRVAIEERANTSDSLYSSPSRWSWRGLRAPAGRGAHPRCDRGHAEQRRSAPAPADVLVTSVTISPARRANGPRRLARF